MEDLRKSPEELTERAAHCRKWADHFEGNDWHQWVLFMEELVTVLAGLHDVDGARAEMARIREAAATQDTGFDADWMWTLASGHHHLAVALEQRHDGAGAVEEYRRALLVWDKRATLHEGDAQSAGLMAASVARMGELLVEQGDLSGAAAAVITSIEVHRRAGADAAEIAWRARWGRKWFEDQGERAGAPAGAVELTRYLAGVPLRAVPTATLDEAAALAVVQTMGARLASGFSLADLAHKYGKITSETAGAIELEPFERAFASASLTTDWRTPDLASRVTLRLAEGNLLTLAALRGVLGEYAGTPEGSPFAPESPTFQTGEGNARFHVQAEPLFVPAPGGSRAVEKLILFV